jgi:type IV pilus assembly protein PilV
LIEVLVALVILAVGLLGLIGLQARLNILQIESYQRAQAMTLLNDMVARMSLNRNATTSGGAAPTATNYLTAAPLGTGMTCDTDASTRRNADLADWCSALQGATETNGGNRGAMVGARGCVEVFDLAQREYRVSVAWQGMAPLAAPPAKITCGAGLYGGGGTACADDVCRRVVTTIVRISDLS